MEAFPRDAAMAETATSAFTRSRAAFDLKGVMTSLTVLRIRSRDLNLIERQLRAKVTQFPQMFQSAPLVLDVGELEGGVRTFPLAALVRALQVCRVVPVAVTNIDDADRSVAMAAGLGVVSLNGARVVAEPDPAVHDSITRKVDRASIAMEHEDRTERTQLPTASEAGSNGRNGSASARPEGTPRPERRPEGTSRPERRSESAAGTPRPAPAAPPAPAAVAAARLPAPITHKPPLVIRQAVRSGQQVYAEKTDLIVLAPVNPGAQLIADGNIHVYAPLRGRAVAGAKGFTEARIFVQKMEAELCAISGAYLTHDDIPKDRLGKPAQLHLQDGKCVLSPL
jgi:septum site-determining protein MinC